MGIFIIYFNSLKVIIFHFFYFISVTEPQIIEYKTQQYRLFPALAHTYAYYFASNNFINHVYLVKQNTSNFENIKPMDLNKIHSVTASIKAMSFTNALKFSQSNR